MLFKDTTHTCVRPFCMSQSSIVTISRSSNVRFSLSQKWDFIMKMAKSEWGQEIANYPYLTVVHRLLLHLQILPLLQTRHLRLVSLLTAFAPRWRRRTSFVHSKLFGGSPQSPLLAPMVWYTYQLALYHNHLFHFLHVGALLFQLDNIWIILTRSLNRIFKLCSKVQRPCRPVTVKPLGSHEVDLVTYIPSPSSMNWHPFSFTENSNVVRGIFLLF